MISDSVNVRLEGPMPQPGWRDQWQRVIRWKGRLDNLSEGTVREFDSASAEDVFHAFFVSCFHLADWIENDQETGIKQPSPREHASTHPALSVCRDLANGHKHLTLDRRASSSDTRLSGRAVDWMDAHDAALATPRYRFEVTWTDDQGCVQARDCADLAKECVEAWLRFVKTNLSGYDSVNTQQ